MEHRPVSRPVSGVFALLVAAGLVLGPVVTGNLASALPDPPGLSVALTEGAAVLATGERLASFVITVSNSVGAGSATAVDVTLTDALPADPGVDWSLGAGYEGPGTCAVTGPLGSQVVGCAFGDLAPAASASVAAWTETNSASPGTFSNTATAAAANDPSVTASDTWVVAWSAALSVAVTADASTVSVGNPIGFTVTVANSSAADTATATDVTVNDPLPSGSGIDWSLSPADGPGACQVSGGTGPQVLTCSLGDMAPGSSTDVHVQSATGPASAGTYATTATATTTTDAASASAGATILVEAPALAVAVTALSSPEDAGVPIGYDIVVTNSHLAGTATATGVTVNDPLPSGPGIDWSFLSSGGCTIGGPVGGQFLRCDLGDMAPGASASVSIGSDTTSGSDGTYLDTAIVSATNSLTVAGSASVVVTTDAITSPARVTVDTGSALSFGVTTTGVPVPSITERGKLPEHVTFVDNGDGTATISGTARVGRPRTFHLTITATFGTLDVATQRLTLRLGDRGGPGPPRRSGIPRGRGSRT